MDFKIQLLSLDSPSTELLTRRWALCYRVGKQVQDVAPASHQSWAGLDPLMLWSHCFSTSNACRGPSLYKPARVGKRVAPGWRVSSFTVFIPQGAGCACAWPSRHFRLSLSCEAMVATDLVHSCPLLSGERIGWNSVLFPLIGFKKMESSVQFWE